MHIDPKTVTFKTLRQPLTEEEKGHVLDVALACSGFLNPDPANELERKEFEYYIATSPEISEEVKDVLATLTEEERKQLFS